MKSIHYFKAWLFFFLIATVGGFILGAILGGILGAILGLTGVGVGTIKIVAGISGFLIGIPLSYFTFYWVVSQFIVKPLLSPPLPGPSPLAVPAPDPSPIAPPPRADGNVS